VTFESNCICCAERRLIKQLKHECVKNGNRIHKFSAWTKRKFGTLIIYRPTSYGYGISLPCVMCRKMIEKYDLRWKAHDGRHWIDSQQTDKLPKSQPTNKQRRLLKFSESS
jgi:hypothetical protein